MATNTYQAGTESNQVELSYGVEAVWGVAPATTFQAIRTTGETLSIQKTRARPNELKTTAEASAGVTQQVAASGAINGALSYGVYDDLFASAMNSAWAGVVNITSAAGDITLAASGSAISSTTSNKFSTIVLGQWIRITTPLNVGYARVATKADSTHFTVSGMTLVDETPSGTTANFKSSGYIRNSNAFQSLFFQKKLASALWLTYPGTRMTGFTLAATQGSFATVVFNAVSKNETKATSDSSTGGVLAAATNTVFDTVAAFQQLQLDGAAISASCKGITIQAANDGQAADYGLGSASAQGMRIGTFTINGGKAEFFFKDYTLYNMFVAETQHTFSYRQTDAAGNTYIFTLNAVVLNNPTITAGGPNTPVMASFDLMADPSASYGTMQIDRIAA